MAHEGGRAPRTNSTSRAGDSNIARRRALARREGSAEYVKRRQELIEAAAAVFHCKGFAAANLGDVAAEAGADRASIYYYVRNKDELFADVIRDSVITVEEETSAIAAED